MSAPPSITVAPGATMPAGSMSVLNGSMMVSTTLPQSQVVVPQSVPQQAVWSTVPPGAPVVPAASVASMAPVPPSQVFVSQNVQTVPQQAVWTSSPPMVSQAAVAVAEPPLVVELPAPLVAPPPPQPPVHVPPPIATSPLAVRLSQPQYVDKVVPNNEVIRVERPVIVKVQPGDPRAGRTVNARARHAALGRAGLGDGTGYDGSELGVDFGDGTGASAFGADGMAGYNGNASSYIHRLNLPPNNTTVSDEKYLEIMAAEGSPAYGFVTGGRRVVQQVQGFPYHDPAFGCHFRNHSMDDKWDEQLQLREPDEEPALEKLMRHAKAEIKKREEQKANRRRLEHLEHKALEKLRLDYLQDGYDEVDAPQPFRIQGRESRHPAMVCVDPEPEAHGLAWWLA